MIQMTPAQLANKIAYRIDPLLAASVEVIEPPFVASRINDEMDVELWRVNRRRDLRLDRVMQQIRKRNHA